VKGSTGEPSAKELRNYYGYIRSRSDRTTDGAMSPIWSGTIKQSHFWKMPQHRRNSLKCSMQLGGFIQEKVLSARISLHGTKWHQRALSSKVLYVIYIPGLLEGMQEDMMGRTCSTF